jgi:hypothetical protein
VSSEAIRIQRRSDGADVEAALLDSMAPHDLLVVENVWSIERSLVMQELLQSAVSRSQWPQSLHWDWQRKAPQLRLLECSGFGIVCEQQWQGVMLTETASYSAKLAPDQGKPLVYIDFLEVAPWNWVIPEIGRSGRFRAVGSTLFWRAVKQSEEEGFQGRVGLHALPQAVPFYERACGMTPLGSDASKQNLLYMELSRQQAVKILQKEEQQ